MNPKVTEILLDSETVEQLQEVAMQAAAFLGVDLHSDSPSSIVRSVDECVFRTQKGDGPKLPKGEQIEGFLGTLWGEAMIREFGWNWSKVILHEHEDVTAIGIFPPDRSLAIYPFHFIFGCIENSVPVTIMLAFEILKDGSRVPSLPEYGYENVMDHAHHEIPRE